MQANLKSLSVCLLILAVATVALCQRAYVARQQDDQHRPPSLLIEKWTGDQRPYKAVEVHILQEYKSGESPTSILEVYRTLSDSHPTDPVAKFAYVYAARGVAVLNGTLDSKAFDLLNILEKADPGNIREYTRYRFCMGDEANNSLIYPDAKIVGDRLLRYNPKDNWVRLSLIDMLCITPEGVKYALPYALQWVKEEPNNNKAHSSLGQVYFDLWMSGKRTDQALAAKAVAEYQTYLRLAPSNDGFRGPAQAFIRNVQQHEARRK